MAGGISFATPSDDISIGSEHSEGMVNQDSVFILYDHVEDEWLDWRPTIPIGRTSPKH